jgi:hypothetical protein
LQPSDIALPYQEAIEAVDSFQVLVAPRHAKRAGRLGIVSSRRNSELESMKESEGMPYSGTPSIMLVKNGASPPEPCREFRPLRPQRHLRRRLAATAVAAMR